MVCCSVGEFRIYIGRHQCGGCYEDCVGAFARNLYVGNQPCHKRGSWSGRWIFDDGTGNVPGGLGDHYDTFDRTFWGSFLGRLGFHAWQEKEKRGTAIGSIFSIGEFNKTAIIERSERSELQKRKSDGGAGLFDVGYSVCDFQLVRLVFLCSQPVLFERRSLRGSFDWGYRVAPTGWGSAGSRAAESEGAGVGGVLGDE